MKKLFFAFSFAVLFFPSLSLAIDCPLGFTKLDETCAPDNPFGDGSIADASNVQKLGTDVITLLLFLTGSISVLFMIIGGYWFMTSGANPDGAKKGKLTVQYAIFGLIIVILSYAIVSVVSNLAIKP